MVSKAFLRSIKIPIACFLFAIAFDISSVASIMTIEVDLVGLNPYCPSLISLCLSVKISSLLSKTFSRIFENWGRREMGL